VVVGEAVDLLEEDAQGLRVAVGQEGVLEDVAEQGRDAGVLVHALDRLGVEGQHLEAAHAGRHELRPAVFGELAGEEAAAAAQLLGLGVHVVHELVDKRDGDLLHLRLGVGHLADENVAAGVDAALGIGIQHSGLFPT